jgi:hypothetical protein
MCHIIMLALEEKTEPERLKAVAKQSGPVVFRSSQRRYTWYFTRKGGCDCGTVIGSLNGYTPSLTENEISRKVRRWKKKGWSEGKVSRAVNSIREDHRMKEMSLSLEIAEWKERNISRGNSWIDFMRGCIKELDGEAFCLLLRFGSEDQRIKVTEEIVTSIDELTAEDLMLWEEDVAYRCQ